MCAQTGFGCTLVGDATGAITGLEEVAVGGKSVNMINYVTLDARLSKNLKGAVTRGPITATVVMEKAIYEACEDASDEDDSESWTLTDANGNTWVGDGWMSNVGESRNTADGEVVFDIEITPEDDWDFTAAS